MDPSKLTAYRDAAKAAREFRPLPDVVYTDMLSDAVIKLVAEVEQARKAERDEIIAKGVAWLADFREQDDDDDIVTYPEGAEMLADFIEALGGHVYG